MSSPYTVLGLVSIPTVMSQSGGLSIDMLI